MSANSITADQIFDREKTLDFSSGLVDTPDFFNNSLVRKVNNTERLLGILEESEEASQQVEDEFDQTVTKQVIEQAQSPDSDLGLNDEDSFLDDLIKRQRERRNSLDDEIDDGGEFGLGGGDSFGIGEGSGEGFTAQVTRYGFVNDPYQSKKATVGGSKYENLGNRNNILQKGISVALSPEFAKKLGVNLKKGEWVEANIGGKWQRFRVDDTTAKGLKNNRIDFFDPEGKRKSIDGSKIRVRKAGSRSSSRTPSNMVSGKDFRKKFNSISVGGSTKQKGGLENLHPKMRTSFSKMYDDMPSHLKKGLTINSAWRSAEYQSKLKGGRKTAMVANAGKSFHQYGGAIDLGINGSLLNSKNGGQHKAVYEWLNANASKYGLNMRLGHDKGRSITEDWQVELADNFDLFPNRNLANAKRYRQLIERGG